MPSLNEETRKKQKKRKWKFRLFLIGVILVLSPLIAEGIDGVLTGLFLNFGRFEFDFSYLRCAERFITERDRMVLTGLLLILVLCSLFFYLGNMEPILAATDVVEVANGIFTPVAIGNGQYGTARFMKDKEIDQIFPTAEYSGEGEVKGLSEKSGIIVDYKKKGRTEFIRYLSEAVNTIILGATRTGKTRRLLMTSTWLNLIAGINLLVVDVKGENSAFTAPFAKMLGYEVRFYDFRNPEKSMRFNNLNEIVELLAEKKISAAVNKAWDIVSVLVGEPQGERIWTDGQCATITAAILIIAQDAPIGCKNLPNVYYFLAYMCEADPETGAMPITKYLENLSYNHPARGAFQIAKIAPFRTRSSFFTSALATLRLFTDWNVADISKESDYTFDDIDDKKVITYIILPDEKKTYHPIGAMYIKQMYESLVEQALKKGGSLNKRFIFRADEIGNFPVIPALGTMLSAGAGRNIFFELVLQDYQQSESKYKDDFRNIKTNCQLTICLKATDPQTTKELSERLGNYTIQINSATSSLNEGKANTASYSNASNMAGRPLLFPEEISRMEAPDALILYGGKKAVTNLPDISEYYANVEFGMGDEDYNKRLFLDRVAERPSHEIGAPKLWGIWEEYGANHITMDAEEDRVSFME